jgi:hypothetical protein
MASHCIVTRSSSHTSFTAPKFTPLAPPARALERPQHTTSRWRLPRNSFAPVRAALHTPSSRHAPTSPLNAAMRAHTSERETARSTAQVSASMRGGEEVVGAVCVW